MARLKGDPIPYGFIACGCAGRAVNVGVSVDCEYRAEAARQRRVWNHFLAIQIDTYAVLGEFVFYHEMARRLTLLRKADLWIGQGGIAAQQQTLRALERAIKDSFPSARNRKGFPRFKKATDRSDAIRVPAKDASWVRLPDGTVTHLRLPNMPLLRVRNLIIPDGARLTSVTIRMDGDGWKVSLGLIKPRPVAATPVVSSLGVDGGLRVLAHAVKDESGFEIVADNPQPLKHALKRLKRSQRKFSRRAKGSVGRRRAGKEVARRHRRVADLRSAHHHRVSRRIVDAAGAITIETLSVKGLMRTRLARSVADAAPGGLIEKIRYKADWAGRPVTLLSRWDRSTGCCPDCDLIGPRLPLSQSEWTCACGSVHDRDRAAGRWLDRRGNEIRNSASAEVGRQSSEPVPSAPKRGLAKVSKDRASARSGRPGPPANVLPPVREARVSTG